MPLAAALWILCSLWSAVTSAGDLTGALEALAAQAGFVVEGLDRIGPEPARNADGTTAERLRTLLQDYNYLVIQSRPGAIEKVLVTSRKAPEARGSADRAHVGTIRIGTQHQVEAILTGPNAVAQTVSLIVDTGASTLVLPTSMIREMGFRPEDLRDGSSQTASGTVPVKTGTLGSVRVGAVAASDVPVSFIADRKLQGAMLLGMSFLQRFRVTIDDARNELVLFAR